VSTVKALVSVCTTSDDQPVVLVAELKSVFIIKGKSVASFVEGRLFVYTTETRLVVSLVMVHKYANIPS
jgi:predicted Kef-type K+ transport protein